MNGGSKITPLALTLIQYSDMPNFHEVGVD